MPSPVESRVNAAIQRKRSYEQAEPITLQLVAVRAGVLVQRTNNAEEFDKLMFLEPQRISSLY